MNSRYDSDREPVTAPEPATLPSEHDRNRRSLLGRILAAVAVAREPCQVRRSAQVRRHLPRGRRLRADLGLALRARLRPAHPRARARPLRRGEAAGARPAAARLHPVPRGLRRAPEQPLRPVARTRSSRSPGRSRAASARRVPARCGEAPGSDLLLALAYAGFFLNLINLIPIGFLDGGHLLRSWRVLRAGGGRPTPPRPGGSACDASSRSCRSRPPRARARHGRRARPAGPAVTTRTASSTAAPAPRRTGRSRADVSLIASEFLAGFEAVERIDRPAVSIFGSARVREGSPSTSAARETGRCFAEAGFAVVTGGGPGRDGGGQPRRQDAGGLSVGFNIQLPHEQGLQPVLRPLADVQALLRAQDDVREGRRGLRHLPRRLRHARRALRVADADPDRARSATSRVVLFDSAYWGEMLDWIRARDARRRPRLALRPRPAPSSPTTRRGRRADRRDDRTRAREGSA